jgi:hypothetical protein
LSSCAWPPSAAELDFPVTENVGVRRAPGPALGEEMLEDPLAIFVAEIDAMKWQPELTCDLAGVLKISRRFTMTIVLPVRHVQALDVVSGIAQQ